LKYGGLSASVKISNIYGTKLIKQHIIVEKTSQFKTVCKDDNDYITTLKQQKLKKNVLLLDSTMATCC